MVSIPGALTPTEIMTAYNLGADLVKIFPIMPGDIPYLKNILAPLSHIPFITTGGVNPETAGTFIRMGAVALAAGATIITPDALANEDYETITENARAHLAAIRKAEEEMR
jgi:2-dehydro-3-deoxyphosphogluconate aldolase/(4S)-4-hydroxy-2-oxoglutarate aldolase